MTCEQFAEIARDAALGRGDLDEARAHVDGCVSCAARLEAEKALSAGLGALSGELRSSEAPPRVEEALLKAFRNAASRPTAPARVVRLARPQAWVFAALAAAAVIAAFLVDWRQPPVAPPEATAARGPLAPAAEAPAAVAAPPAASRARRPAPAVTAARAATRTEVATDFFPLRYGRLLEPGESAQLVRIELPRTEMARFGLAPPYDTAAATVRADVLMGEDGIARAVRFVD